jgi:hypothetical protein
MRAYLEIGAEPAGPPPVWSRVPGATGERDLWMEDKSGLRRITLSSLEDGMPGLTPSWGGVLAEASSVCLEDRGHGLVVELSVEGRLETTLALERLAVDPRMRRAHQDENRATEHGACGISILALRSLTGFTVLYQSRGKSGFDYFLGPEDEALFQVAARLEVSGIRNGTGRKIRARTREKLAQIQRAGIDEPVLIAIVEFSRPRLRLEEA